MNYWRPNQGIRALEMRRTRVCCFGPQIGFGPLYRRIDWCAGVCDSTESVIDYALNGCVYNPPINRQGVFDTKNSNPVHFIPITSPSPFFYCISTRQFSDLEQMITLCSKLIVVVNSASSKSNRNSIYGWISYWFNWAEDRWQHVILTKETKIGR